MICIFPPPIKVGQTGSLPEFPERPHRRNQGKLPVCPTLAPRFSFFQGVATRHEGSSYGFYIRRNYFFGPSNAQSIENAPPPLTKSATAMPIASRWYSKPSPACFPVQFIKNPYCW